MNKQVSLSGWKKTTRKSWLERWNWWLNHMTIEIWTWKMEMTRSRQWPFWSSWGRWKNRSLELKRSRNSDTRDVKVTENVDGSRGGRKEGEVSAPVFTEWVMERLLMIATKWEKGYIAWRKEHPKDCGFYRIRRRKGTEVAEGSKKANFPISRLWDMWIVREKVDPIFECNGENHILGDK